MSRDVFHNDIDFLKLWITPVFAVGSDTIRHIPDRRVTVCNSLSLQRCRKFRVRRKEAGLDREVYHNGEVSGAKASSLPEVSDTIPSDQGCGSQGILSVDGPGCSGVVGALRVCQLRQEEESVS